MAFASDVVPPPPQIEYDIVGTFQGTFVYVYEPKVENYLSPTALNFPRPLNSAMLAELGRNLHKITRKKDNTYACFATLEHCKNQNSLYCLTGSVDEYLLNGDPTEEEQERFKNILCDAIHKKCSAPVLDVLDKVWSKIHTEKLSLKEIQNLYKKILHKDQNLEDIVYHAVDLGISRHVKLILNKLASNGIVIKTLKTKDGLQISLWLIAKRYDTVFSHFKPYLNDLNDDEIKLAAEYDQWYHDRRFVRTKLDINDSNPDKTRDTFNFLLAKLEKDDINQHLFREVKETVLAFMDELAVVIQHGNNTALPEIRPSISIHPPDAEELKTMCHDYKQITPLLVGSSAEGTRCFYPDEFDFLFLLDYTDDIKFDFETKTFHLGDKSLTDHISASFFNALRLALEHFIHKPFKGKLILEATGYFDPKVKFPYIYFTWRCDAFKDMKITADIVPAFKLRNKVILPGHVKSEIPDCSFSYISVRVSNLTGNRFDVAFSPFENDVIKKLSVNIRRGYKIAKSMRHSELIAPAFAGREQHYVDLAYFLQDFLPSYWLKTSLLFITHLPHDDRATCSDIYWAYCILKQLSVFINKGLLPHYFYSSNPSRFMSYVFSCETCRIRKVRYEKGLTKELTKCQHCETYLIVIERMIRILEEHQDTHRLQSHENEIH